VTNRETMSPKVSVCIPVRNGGDFLPLAVDSVLQQSFDDYELIIVDNCSTDRTVKWIEERLSAAPRIRFYKNATNIGLVGNFNACLAHAKGEYIKFLCADDLLLPDGVRRMSEALDADSSVALVTGGRRLINEGALTLSTQRYAAENVRLPGTDVINRCIFGKNYIGEPSAVMFRRTAAQRGFQESLPHLMDLEMWFHLLEQGSMVNLADEVCAIRQYAGQMSQQNVKTGALIDDNVRLFDAYGNKPYIQNTWTNRTSRQIRIAYRVWICRDALSSNKRNQILTSSSSRIFYYTLMPMLAGMLTMWRKAGLSRG
jgi:glycosyltransferase involved in cell wall biosynthesis